MTDVTTAVISAMLAEPSITAFLSDRIYPITIDDAPSYPAACVNKVFGGGEYDLSGDVGVEQARVQIDLYSATGQGDLIAVSQAVRRFWSGYRGADCEIDSVRCIDDRDFTETSTEAGGPRLRRRMQEYLVFNKGV